MTQLNAPASKPLEELYSLWEDLADIPVATGNEQFDADCIEEAFLHFPVNTNREDIWHWFECQNPHFLCGEMMTAQLATPASSY